MSTVEESIEVRAPVGRVYHQWTEVEDYPRFMGGVVDIESISSARSRWKTRIAGVERDFEAEVVEQTQDERIVWQSLETEGPRQSGVVTVQRVSDDVTRVVLRMEYDPEGYAELAGDNIGIVREQLKGDLERFKELVEDGGAQG